MSSGPTTVIQVTNLSASVTSDQMRTLFSFLGDVEELRLYPPDNAPLAFSSKVCYIKFREPASVGVAQHLTNTVFIDRALIVVPCAEGKIPEEAKALSLLAPAPALSSLLPGAGLLPIPTPSPSSLASVLRRDKVDVPLLSVPFATLAATLPTPLEPVIPALAPVLPVLTPAIPALGELPQPPLMGNVDPTKVDEIRRTIYVGNLNSQVTTTAEQLLEFFKQVGDVRFVRMAGDETQPTRFAFVEFSDQNSVTRALTFNGVMFGDRPLKINHSNNAIVKPPELTPQAAAKELEEVMKRVREAQSLISEAIEPETGKPVEKIVEKHSTTRSHSRSKSRSRWKRSHSKHRSRSRNRSRSKHKECRKSKSPHKKRSRSKDQHKSKSRSRSRDKKRDKDRSKFREKDKIKEKNDKRRKDKRSKSPSKSHTSVRKSRSVSRERRKRRSRSLSKSPRSSKTVKRVSRSPSPRRKEKKRGKERDHSGDRRESDRSSSRKNSNKDKDLRESADKYKIREKDQIKYDRDSVNENIEDKHQANSRHNGNCKMNDSTAGKTDVA
ncbi:splicing regulatory glutamine/lysine-rich protein 1 isoform X3 [Mixophyes fleayi]|uniref:splicing regulatory glutamine/lysine-rich protein 1 isoform X3 n=1 Tax=Mixophyes fleayi TaxID=3061075 RepID=UPI003F4DB34E